MKDEGFLSPAGRRFVVVSALILLAGVIAYYATADEGISLDFLDDIELEGTGDEETSSTVSVPDVTVPDFPEPPSVQALPPSAQDQLQEAERIGECISRAEGDVEAIQACATQ